MGAFGSTIGGIMTMGSLFLGGWLVFTFTDKYYPLLWFILFGILGGVALGALNGRKARTQIKYKNEYTAYAGMFFAAIVLMGSWYFFFALDKITKKINDDADLSAEEVLGISVGAGLMLMFGLGLVVANSLADGR